MRLLLVFIAFICHLQTIFSQTLHWPNHSLESQINAEIAACVNVTYCDENLLTISSLMVRLVNDHSTIMLSHRAQMLCRKYFAALSVQNPPKLRLRIEHFLSVLAFAQGDLSEAERHYPALGLFSIASQRSLAAQLMIAGSEKTAAGAMLNYTTKLGSAFVSVLQRNNLLRVPSEVPVNDTNSSSRDVPVIRASSTEESEDALLSLLLNEAQGMLRLNTKLSDLELSVHDIRPIDARQRFRLGVGLAKLGLFDLSLRHVSLSATPWEGPLFRLRARLVFSPVHSSVRMIAHAVDQFVRQGEGILGQPIPVSSLLTQICDSPNEAALALQSLPLLHLAGFAAPRARLLLGHSPVALPILLSEVFESLCPPIEPAKVFTRQLALWNSSNFIQNISSSVKRSSRSGKLHSRTGASELRQQKFVVGIVAGSLDGVTGRIIIGLAEELKKLSMPMTLIAMCFPTPRDKLTDRASKYFDEHINLSPYNKTQAMERITESEADLILFADAALDSRVFTLAHERLAFMQAAYWSWGGTLGIPTIDYYFIPEVLIQRASCPMPLRYSDIMGKPQQFFAEQVVLLEGLPHVIFDESAELAQFQKVMAENYLLPNLNESHIYVFPGTVKHVHPEFDLVLSYILRTDPRALVVLAISRSGRDKLPPTHVAIRHDLMHPANPAAAVAKLRARLSSTLGDGLIDRIRVLPPLEERIYVALLRSSVAVLDPYPVGMHTPILEALLHGVPVISSPELQECTNSHTDSLTYYLGVGPYFKSTEQNDNASLSKSTKPVWPWPTSAEEYAVTALRAQSDLTIRESFAFTKASLDGLRQGTNTNHNLDIELDEIDHVDPDDTDDVKEDPKTSTYDLSSHGGQVARFVEVLYRQSV